MDAPCGEPEAPLVGLPAAAAAAAARLACRPSACSAAAVRSGPPAPASSDTPLPVREMKAGEERLLAEEPWAKGEEAGEKAGGATCPLPAVASRLTVGPAAIFRCASGCIQPACAPGCAAMLLPPVKGVG